MAREERRRKSRPEGYRREKREAGGVFTVEGESFIRRSVENAGVSSTLPPSMCQIGQMIIIEPKTILYPPFSLHLLLFFPS